MEKLIYDIIDYIDLIRRDYSLQASFYFSYFPIEHIEILYPRVMHDNKYCACVKKGSFKSCISYKENAIAASPSEPYRSRCWAGVEELIFPVVIDDKPVNYISVSGYRLRESTPDFTEVFECDEADSRRLTRAYKALCTDIPEIEDIKTVIMPLVNMVKLYMMNTKLQPKSIENGGIPPLYNEILTYLMENFKSNITLEDISKSLNYSVSHISHIFKEYNGTSVTRYLIDLKIKKAEWMLKNTTLGISEISDELGFSDAHYFSSRFKAANGMSPKEYRNT